MSGSLKYFIGILLLLCQLALVSAQQTSKGAVHGVLTNAQTGVPVAGAQVRLWRELLPGERNRSNQSVEASTPLISRLLLLPEVFPSDAAGRYSATNLDEGVYRLVVVNARGFSRQEYGQPAQNMRANPQTHGTLGRSFRVSRGTTMTGIDVRLNRPAVIAGRVTDSDGKPIIGITVQLQPIEYDGQGRRVLYPGDLNTRTNDRGEYRIADVHAGRFFVVAGIPGVDIENRTRFLELKQKRYVWTFYPSSPNEQGAAIINVKPDDERQRIDIVVVRQNRLYSIRGRVIDATTGRVPSGTITLSASHLLADGGRGTGGPTSSDTTTSNTRATYNSADGSFELQGLELGLYELGGAQGRNRLIDGNIVNVENADLDDVVLTVGGATAIEGRISADKRSIATSALGGTRIRLIRAVAFGQEVTPVQPGPEGRFRINDLKLGEYRLTVSDLPRGTYVKDIRIDGTTVVNSTWVFKGGALPREIDVRIGSDTGSVSGRVQGVGPAVEVGHVVLIPEQRGRIDLYKAATVDRSGTFNFDGVAPGRYRVFAWDSLQPNEYYDDDFIKMSGERGVAVTVLPDAKISVEPSLILKFE